MHHLALFASGKGSNAQKILEFFQFDPNIIVSLVVSTRRDAGVLDIAREHGVPTYVLQRESFYRNADFLEVLKQYKVDFIVLAGFLWLAPAYLVKAFPRRIVNIHPALLPKYGGKGMYGMHVHSAVRAAADSETGITIHYVDERYDEGDIIFQTRCPVAPDDTPEDIARKVQALEHRHYPEVIRMLVAGLA